MKTISLKDGDIHLDRKGNLAIAEGAEGLRQKIETRLKLYKGEWFLNVNSGVPWLQRILGRGSSSERQGISDGAINQIFDSEVLKETEVKSIIRSDSTFDANDRSYSYTAELQTVYGTVKVEV